MKAGTASLFFNYKEIIIIFFFFIANQVHKVLLSLYTLFLLKKAHVQPAGFSAISFVVESCIAIGSSELGPLNCFNVL